MGKERMARRMFVYDMFEKISAVLFQRNIVAQEIWLLKELSVQWKM